MRFIEKLERKHPNWGIRNLMAHVTIVTGVVYVLYILKPSILSYIVLERGMIFEKLQLWRLVTFVFYPPSLSMLWILLSLYFYYFLGRTLENQWGSFKFTCYYLLCMLGTIAAALIFGGAYSGVYVNLSMFLAFAYLYPNYEFLLFFILPIKVKYLAYLDIAMLVLSFIMGGLTTKLSIIASLTGLIVFFGRDIIHDIKAWIRRMKYKNRF